jgi:hypothetical protein
VRVAWFNHPALTTPQPGNHPPPLYIHAHTHAQLNEFLLALPDCPEGEGTKPKSFKSFCLWAAGQREGVLLWGRIGGGGTWLR